MADDTPSASAPTQQATTPTPSAPVPSAPTAQASAPTATSQASPPRSTEQASVGEVIEYVKAYAKQETVGPLMGAGRWIAFGAAGAIAMGIGLSYLLLGLLRLLQSEWDRSASGRLSWLAYLVVLFACIALLALVVSRINKTFLDPEDK